MEKTEKEEALSNFMKTITRVLITTDVLSNINIISDIVINLSIPTMRDDKD